MEKPEGVLRPFDQAALLKAFTLPEDLDIKFILFKHRPHGHGILQDRGKVHASSEGLKRAALRVSSLKLWQYIQTAVSELRFDHELESRFFIETRGLADMYDDSDVSHMSTFVESHNYQSDNDLNDGNNEVKESNVASAKLDCCQEHSNCRYVRENAPGNLSSKNSGYIH